MNAKKTVSLRILTAWAIMFLPALALLCLILYFAVDVPLQDDWDLQGMTMEHILKGDRDTFSIFFGQSVESRPAFPLLIYAAVGLTVGWHVPVFMLMNWLCALLTFVSLLKLIPGGHASRPIVFPCVALLLAGLLFSPIQWKNWLWATQLMQFIPPLCIALCLRFQISRYGTGLKVICSALLCIVATFSPPNGMLCWVLAFPFLLIPFTGWSATAARQRVRTIGWVVIYLALATLTIGFYFWGYEKPRHGPSTEGALQDFAVGLEYFLVWVGAPLAAGMPELPILETHVAAVAGASLLLLFSFALVLVCVKWRRAPDSTIRTSWPWICLAGYGIATGAATTIARAGWGMLNITPRYLTHSLWVTVGMVGLAYSLWNSAHQRNRRVWNAGIGAAMAAVSLLMLSSWIVGVDKMQRFSGHLRQNLLTLRLLEVAPSNPLWKRVYPFGKRQLARFLIEADILETELVGNWITEKIQQPEAGIGGRFRIVGTNERGYHVEGWAVLPGRAVPPDFVVLARPGPRQLEIVSGIATRKSQPSRFDSRVGRLAVGVPDDTLAYFNSPRLFEEVGLVMFAVDAEQQRVYRMERDHEGSKLVTHYFAHRLDSAEISERKKGNVMRKEAAFAIGGEWRKVLFQHPDSDIVFKDVFVGKRARLECGVAINPAAWGKPGDGVMFEISVVDRHSRRTTVFSRRIDPKNNPRDRRWFDESIDLSGFAGQEIAVRFRTTSGGLGDSRFDWAAWSTPQIVYPLADGDRTGIVSLTFVHDLVRIQHPLTEKRLELLGRRLDGRNLDLSTHEGTRFSSSDPRVIEILRDGRLIAHRHGVVEVVATHGKLEARCAVESAWPPVIPCGVGSPGKGGIVPVLDTDSQQPRVGNSDFQMRVSKVVGGATGVLIAVRDPASKSISLIERSMIMRLKAAAAGTATRVAPIDCEVFPVTVTGRRGIAGQGIAKHALPIPNEPEPLGRLEYWQGFFRDDEAKSGWSVTNGLVITVK